MFTVKEVIDATKGVLLQGARETYLSGVSTDTRSILPENLFIALRGETFDGHDFLATARKKSAAAVIVSQTKPRIPEIFSAVKVRDTSKALGNLARAHRNKFKIPIIAVTGSAGKTTTKEMVAAVLSTRYNVLKNFATHNNHVGVPQTLLKLNHSHDIAVIEMGTNRFGDIRWLTQVAAPTVALLTNIGESHLEFLKSPEGVFREKSDLLRFMEPGTVIFNGDDRYLGQLHSRRWPHRLIGFGLKDDAEIQAEEVKITSNKIRFRARGVTFELLSPAPHNVLNALAAISCGLQFGVPIADIRRALKSFDLRSGRQSVEKVGPWWVIDDTYNANPVSFRSAIETLKNLKTPGRKIVVCGDMLELGSSAKKLHAQVGSMLASLDPELLLAVGAQTFYLVKAAQKGNPKIKAAHCSNLEDLHRRLLKFCREGDAILIKGSRGMRMERTVEFLKAKAARKAGV